MLVASATAFAGDSPALKEILKAKTYAEAEALVKSNLGQLANDQEKAKAYNKLVDLAFDAYSAESKKITENMMAKQFGKDPVPVDNDLIVNNGTLALQMAQECDKYDVLPDAKGKVSPKFQDKNRKRMAGVFNDLQTIGLQSAEANKNEEAFKCLDIYFANAGQPLFKDVETVKNNPNRGVAAFYGGRAAVQLQKYARAAEFFKVGVQDTAKQIHDLSFEFLLYSMRLSQQTAADSAKYLSDMKELYAQYPENDQVFGSLTDIYMAKGDNAEVLRLSDAHLAKFPNSALPHVYKAFLLMQDKKYNESIAEFDLVPATAPAYLQCVFNRAVCKYNKAADFNEANSDIRTGRLTPENEKTYRGYLEDAQKDFEKAQELDPDQLTVKWGYLLKNIYIATGQQEKADAIL